MRENVERIHLISRKDLNNICRSYGISQNNNQMHENDSISIAAWVENQRNLTNNCVLFYKEQGQYHPEVHNDDFILIIMNKLQHMMMMKLGTDRICIDSTHGITGYDFELTTVMVIDEYEEGFPVAFCLSSTVNTQIVKLYFQSIKKVIGEISCNIFMSDDACMFINAWTEIMGSPKKRLLCAWHVDRAWQGHLNLIKDKDKKSAIYKTLKICLYELNRERFVEMFNELLQQLQTDEETIPFYTYINNYYANRVELWAYAYRTGARINTNMHIENFHSKLKSIYLEGKKSKRVDKCVLALMDYLEDKQFDRLIKLHKGKQTYKSSNLMSRHNEGMNIIETCKKLSSTLWIVPSQSKNNENYKIRQVLQHLCSNSCKISCKQCGVCYKSFECMCHDYLILGNICKHIHAVKMKSHNSDLAMNTQFHHTSEYLEESSFHFKLLMSNKSEQNSNSVKDKVLCKIHQLISAISQVDNISESIIPAVLQHINAAKNLIELGKTHYNPSNFFMSEAIKKEPANKKAEKQKRFYSVKKKHSKKSKLSKPNNAETIDTRNILLKQELQINNGELDHNYSL